MNGPEETIASVVQYLKLAVETTGAAMVALGAAIAPSLEEIGKLEAIAVIRTGLNYFLSLEMKSERPNDEASRRVQARAESRPEPAR